MIRNRSRNRIILTQKNRNRILAPGSDSGSCHKIRFITVIRYRYLRTGSNIRNGCRYIFSVRTDRTQADPCVKLAREETKNKVKGRSLYCTINFKFKDRDQNRKKRWNLELKPRQNGTVLYIYIYTHTFTYILYAAVSIYIY